MTDSIVYRIETEIREATAFRAHCDRPDTDMHRHLMAVLDRERPHLQRQDVLRLEALIERRTGVRGQ